MKTALELGLSKRQCLGGTRPDAGLLQVYGTAEGSSPQFELSAGLEERHAGPRVPDALDALDDRAHLLKETADSITAF